jgi:hypothetical protein
MNQSDPHLNRNPTFTGISMMARPGLEPGTPRSSVVWTSASKSRKAAICRKNLRPRSTVTGADKSRVCGLIGCSWARKSTLGPKSAHPDLPGAEHVSNGISGAGRVRTLALVPVSGSRQVKMRLSCPRCRSDELVDHEHRSVCALSRGVRIHEIPAPHKQLVSSPTIASRNTIRWPCARGSARGRG